MKCVIPARDGLPAFTAVARIVLPDGHQCQSLQASAGLKSSLETSILPSEKCHSSGTYDACPAARAGSSPRASRLRVSPAAGRGAGQWLQLRCPRAGIEVGHGGGHPDLPSGGVTRAG
jgi:hypothetical protein